MYTQPPSVPPQLGELTFKLKCPVCYKIFLSLKNQLLCLDCNDTLSHQVSYKRRILLSPDKPQNLISASALLPFNKTTRKCLHLCKISNSYAALDLLSHLLLNNRSFLTVLAKVSFVYPAPSSLWGRMNGKFDLPGYISRVIETKLKKRILRPPFLKTLSLHSRLLKRAKMSKRKDRESNILYSSTLPVLGNGDILVLDDVITSGKTAEATSAALNAYSVHWFSLIDACRRG